MRKGVGEVYRVSVSESSDRNDLLKLFTSGDEMFQGRPPCYSSYPRCHDQPGLSVAIDKFGGACKKSLWTFE